MNNESIEGLWNYTVEMEITASHKLKEVILPYEKPLQDLYECGVEVVTLKSVRSPNSNEDLRMAALFLKRCLTDLRAIWRLLNIGYTSQAASIAAATFEYALQVSAISGRLDRVQIIKQASEIDSPWRPKKLCQMEAQEILKEAKKTGKEIADSQYENIINHLYDQYKWLCKIKHPTLLSAQYDAYSSGTGNGEYVVMAVPDFGEIDLYIKYKILNIVIERVQTAVRKYSYCMGLNHEDKKVLNWIERFNRIKPAMIEAYMTLDNVTVPVKIVINQRKSIE